MTSPSWASPPAHVSDRTNSCPSSAREEWVRSTGPAMNAWAETSRSRSCSVVPDGVAARPGAVPSARRSPWPGCSTPTSARFTTSADADGRAFLVMELLQGETLQHRLRARARLAFQRSSIWPLRSPDALCVAHAAGIVHRDIKPANIFLTERGPKILDFGLAKGRPSRRRRDRWRRRCRRDAHGRPGTTVGTVGTCRPNNFAAKPVDARSDLFSLGMVMYEMATGTVAIYRCHECSDRWRDSARGTRAVAKDAARPGGPIPATHAQALEKDRELRYQTRRGVASRSASPRDDSTDVKAGSAPMATDRSGREPNDNRLDRQCGAAGLVRRRASGRILPSNAEVDRHGHDHPR